MLQDFLSVMIRLCREACLLIFVTCGHPCIINNVYTLITIPLTIRYGTRLFVMWVCKTEEPHTPQRRTRDGLHTCRTKNKPSAHSLVWESRPRPWRSTHQKVASTKMSGFVLSHSLYLSNKPQTFWRPFSVVYQSFCHLNVNQILKNGLSITMLMSLQFTIPYWTTDSQINSNNPPDNLAFDNLLSTTVDAVSGYEIETHLQG